MTIASERPLRLGFVPANRGFFSSKLAAEMRERTIVALEALGVEVVVPTPDQTEVGCVQNRDEAVIAARMMREADVDGIVIGAVNFGDEQSAAWAVREARLDVPVFIYGCQEEAVLSRKMSRRDSFCGLLSIGEALRQIGVKYSVGSRPILYPSDPAFSEDIRWFMGVCRVVNGLRRARYGQVGARPEDFWTCRFDEKQLQRLGATTVVIDLSEALAGANAFADDDPDVLELITSIRGYADVGSTSDTVLGKLARFELFLRRWSERNDLDALAIQCWTSIQANYGACSCLAMSRLGNEGIPAACEADILGTLSMHALQLAGGTPAALADWNNLHNEDDELVNVWHCGVFPAVFTSQKPKIGVQEIIAGSGAAEYEDSVGTVEFVADPGALTLSRVTQDPDGSWKAVIAEGALEDNPADTFGSYGWCRIPDLQGLYRDVLMRHFPHHVGITKGHCGNVLWEAFGNYLGFQVFHAGQSSPGSYTPVRPFAHEESSLPDAELVAP
jgi:L-fucose isomerase-like protein